MKKYLCFTFIVALSHAYGSGQNQFRNNMQAWRNTPGGESVAIHGAKTMSAANKKYEENQTKLRQAINVFCKKEEGILKEFMRLWRIVSTAKIAEEREAKMAELSRYCSQNTPMIVSLPAEGILAGKEQRALDGRMNELLRENYCLRHKACGYNSPYSVENVSIEYQDIYEGAQSFPKLIIPKS